MTLSSIFIANSVASCFSGHITFFFCLCSQVSLLSILKIAFRAHQDNPRVPLHLKNLNSDLQSPFTHKVTFTVFQNQDLGIWGVLYSAYHSDKRVPWIGGWWFKVPLPNWHKTEAVILIIETTNFLKYVCIKKKQMKQKVAVVTFYDHLRSLCQHVFFLMLKTGK